MQTFSQILTLSATMSGMNIFNKWLYIAMYPMTLAETSKLGSLRDWRWMSRRRRVEWPERLASPSAQPPVGTMKISPHSVGGATSRHVTSRHVTSRHVTSRHVTSRHVTSRHVTSRHVTSHHITSHHITSHHITSHHITSQTLYIYIYYIYIIYLHIVNISCIFCNLFMFTNLTTHLTRFFQSPISR